MYLITKSILALMISFLISVFLGLTLIPILRQFKINQNLSIYLSEKHKSKKNTPTMGGLLFITSTIITILILLTIDILIIFLIMLY